MLIVLMLLRLTHPNDRSHFCTLFYSNTYTCEPFASSKLYCHSQKNTEIKLKYANITIIPTVLPDQVNLKRKWKVNYINEDK